MSKETTVNDDAAYCEALQKQKDLEARRLETDRALRAAVEQGRGADRVAEEARCIVAGESIESATDLSQLRHELEVLTKACELQSRITDKAREAAFQPICAAAKPAHSKLIQEWARAGQQFLIAGDKVRAFVGDVLSRGDGAALTSPLMQVAIDPQVESRLKHALDTLETSTAGY